MNDFSNNLTAHVNEDHDERGLSGMSETYYLQCNDAEHDSDLRTVIDTKHMGGWSLRAKPIQADSWLDAKRKFGFELSEAQKRLVGE